MSVPAKEIAVMPARSLTAADVREHVNLVQSVMQAVMKKDTHYGVIPGCKQPSLYKAGSEVLLSTFRIAVSVQVEDLSDADCVRYRVRTIGTHQGTGIVVGEGIGECSSNEDKYKWRKAYDKEFEATPETRRRIKYGKDYSIKQVRTEPADVANTILKMAKKRAQIDLTLTATAASDIFTQDIEDLPEELRDDDAPAQERKTEAKPAYSAEAFAKNLPAWKALVAAGTTTPQQILAKLESKATITQEQRTQVLGLAAPAAQAATTEQPPAEQAPAPATAREEEATNAHA